MDINGAVAFSSTGRFAALKPHHFRWEIESPDRQLLVATPEAFWQWDKDLDVVILRDAPEIEDLPISAIWNGAVDDRSSSDVETGHFGDGVKNLSVRSPDENTIIVRFEDSLGQRTLFEFNLETQGVVTSSAFAVTVPDGVDFYDETSRSWGALERSSDLSAVARGALGASSRFGMGQWLADSGYAHLHPATFLYVIGALLIGILFVGAERFTLSEPARLGMSVGFLGAFTTFLRFHCNFSRIFRKVRYCAHLMPSATVFLCPKLSGWWSWPDPSSIKDHLALD